MIHHIDSRILFGETKLVHAVFKSQFLDWRIHEMPEDSLLISLDMPMLKTTTNIQCNTSSCYQPQKTMNTVTTWVKLFEDLVLRKQSKISISFNRDWKRWGEIYSVSFPCCMHSNLNNRLYKSNKLLIKFHDLIGLVFNLTTTV